MSRSSHKQPPQPVHVCHYPVDHVGNVATFSRTSVLGRGLPRPASVNNTDSTRQFLALGARNATRLRARRCGDLRESALAPLAPESLDTARLGRVPPALSATPERGPPTSAPYSALTPPTPGSYRQHGGPRNRRGPLPGPARPELDSLARESLHNARLARAQARFTTPHRSEPEPGTVALSTTPERPVGGCGPARRLVTASKLARINFRPNLTLLFSLLRTTQQREPHGARCGRAPFGRPVGRQKG